MFAHSPSLRFAPALCLPHDDFDPADSVVRRRYTVPPPNQLPFYGRIGGRAARSTDALRWARWRARRAGATSRRLAAPVPHRRRGVWVDAPCPRARRAYDARLFARLVG